MAALVQHNSGQENNSTDVETVFTAASTTSGNCITVEVTVYAASSTPTLTVTDNHGNTYTLVASDETNGFGFVYTYVAKNITGGSSHSVTVTDTAQTKAYITVAIKEWSGVDTTTPVAASAHSNTGSTSSTSYTTPSIVIPAGAPVLATASEDTATTFTADTAHGFAKTDDVATGQDLHSQSQVSAAGGTFGAKFAWAASTKAAGVIVALNPASGGTLVSGSATLALSLTRTATGLRTAHGASTATLN